MQTRSAIRAIICLFFALAPAIDASAIALKQLRPSTTASPIQRQLRRLDRLETMINESTSAQELEQHVNEVLEYLSHEEPRFRANGLGTLGYVSRRVTKDPDQCHLVVDAIANAIENDSSEVVAEVGLGSLSKYAATARAKEKSDIVMKLVAAESVRVAAEAAAALHKLGRSDDRAIAALVAALDRESHSGAVVANAARALGGMGKKGQSAIPAIETRLASASGAAKKTELLIALALIDPGNAAAAKSAKEILKHGPALQREHVITAMSPDVDHLFSDSVAEHLLQLAAKDTNEEFRTHAKRVRRNRFPPKE